FLGIPWTSYGLWFYSALFLYACFGSKLHAGNGQRFHSIMTLLASFSVLLSIYLFCVSKFVIEALCPYCMSLYLVNFLILGACWFASEQLGLVAPLRRSIVEVKAVLTSSEILKLLALAGIATMICLLPKQFYKQEPVQVVSHPKKFANELFVDDGLLGDYSLGDPQAKVRIVEFSDIQCPYCRWYSGQIEPLIEEYRDQIHFVFKNFPLDNNCNRYLKGPMHLFACEAAEFARCAGEQGVFWRVLHDLYQMPFFESKSVVGEDLQRELMTYAEKTGLDKNAIEDCMQSDRQRNRIVADIDQGHAIELSGTPTLVLNGELQEDIKIESLRKKIDELLKTNH
ncbi:MAG: thioredoxin domain-containing protein, partial [Bdellovibrionales bacterium]|nr:thioredoxin domain-containing protein [Bdellovibrionales bacterium]